MASGRASFEIQVMKAGRWVAESVRDSEEEALTLAKKLFAAKTCEGSRVIRNWLRGDGRMVESEIYSQTREVRDDGPVRIATVEDVPPRCEKTEEYYALPSRMVMNRLFRPYLEKVTLTPTELIHNYKELRRIQDKDSLVPSAVDRVAALQTRESDMDARVRREEIFQKLDRMAVRARKADAMQLPAINGSFHAAYKTVKALAERDSDTDYLALVVLSRELVGERSWLGKLDRLCGLALEEADPSSLGLLDGVIADVLGANVVQEILGWQASLAHAIVAMFDLADGKLPEKPDAGESTHSLNRLFREGKLPASRLSLLDRAHRQLRLANPLYRNDPSKEAEAFRMVAERVLTPTGLLCGAETADALTIRQTRLVEEGGGAGRRAAMSACLRALPDRASGVIYLCDLSAGQFAAEHMNDMAALLDNTCTARSAMDFCQRGVPPRDLMQRGTNAYRAIEKSAFAPQVRRRAMGLVDGMLERYVIENKIVEKLDHHDSPLRDRAIRLVQFCASGVLPEGKALARARERTLALLRQPNFDGSFVIGMTDPAQAQKALRDFHQLLLKAGFGK